MNIEDALDKYTHVILNNGSVIMIARGITTQSNNDDYETLNAYGQIVALFHKPDIEEVDFSNGIWVIRLKG